VLKTIKINRQYSYRLGILEWKDADGWTVTIKQYVLSKLPIDSVKQIKLSESIALC